MSDTWKITNGLVLCLFGQMEIWYRGRDITKEFKPPQQKLLIHLLLDHHRPQSREELIEKLWPEESDSDDPATVYRRRQSHLRQLVYKLRLALKDEADRLQNSSGLEGEALQFDISNVLVDAFQFQELIRRSGYAGQERCKEEAILFYRAHLLTAVNDDRVTEMREQLKEEYFKNVIALAGQAVREGAPHRAEEWLRTALLLSPLEERLVRELITLFGKSGRIEDMTIAYDRLCRALKDLDPILQPELGTRDIFHDLQAKISAAQVTVTSPVPPTAAVSPFYVPAPIRALVGQESLCEELIPLLYLSRIVTLTGPGGIGKTRVALEIAQRVVSLFREGVAFADLTLVPSTALPQDILRVIARSLGAPNESTVHPEAWLHSFLAQKELLLILDNCEQIVSPVNAVLKQLLPRHSSLHLLVTSREPLSAVGELPRKIPPLPTPSVMQDFSLSDLESSDAARLFLQRVSRIPFPVSQETATDIGWICRTLEGIPLAIEIAAAALDQFETTRQLADSMQQSLWSLPKVEQYERDHARTLESTIRWSYELLLPEERTFLQSISVLTGGGDLATLKEISGQPETLAFVRRLEARSLVVSQSPLSRVTDLSTHRFRLLEPVRQFAADRLKETRQENPVFQRHAVWFTRLAEQMTPRLRGQEQTESLQRLEEDQSNLDAALSWSLREDALPEEHEIGMRLVGNLWLLWIIRGGQATGHPWMNKALSYRDIASPEVRIRLLQGGGHLAIFRDDFDLARACFQEAEEFAQQIRNRGAEASALGGLASVARKQKEPDLERAKELLQNSLKIFQELQDYSRVAGVLGNLANISLDKGDEEDAVRYHLEAGDLFVRLKDVHGLLLNLNNLANTYFQIGQLDRMAKTLREVLPQSQQTDNRREIVHALTLAISLLHKQGRHEESAVCMGIQENLRERYQLPLAPKWAAQYAQEKEESRALLGDTHFPQHFQQGSALGVRAAIDYVVNTLSWPLS